MSIFKKTKLEEFEKKIKEKVKKVKEIEKKEVEKLESPLSKIIITGVIITLVVILLQYFPKVRAALEITSVLNAWWIYLTAAVILFLFLLSFKRFLKKTFTIEGEADKIVEEVNELLKKEKNLRKEEKKIKKEIEVLVGKTLELFELSKERKTVKKKGKELQKALEKPFKDQKDVRRVLQIMDDLLAKLPEEELERFARSEAAKLYEKVMKKYGIK